jgi:hypothetical protein
MPETTPNTVVSRVSLWSGLFGGAIAWTIHFMSAYVVAEFGCAGSFGDRSYGNISFVAWLELILTAAAVVVAAGSTAVAYRSELRLLSSVHDEGTPRCAERYTARAGLLTSGIFTFIILFESIPIFFYLHEC